MTPIKISQLPQFFGDSSGSYVVINDSNNAVTYTVKKEDFLSGSFYGTASYALTASYAMNGGGGAAFPYSGYAIITGSLAQGIQNIAFGPYSNAQGSSSWAIGTSSHAEGKETFAYGAYSHTEGSATFTSVLFSNIVSVDVGNNIIEVTSGSFFQTGHDIAYVYNAGNNGNQVWKGTVAGVNDNYVTASGPTLQTVNGSAFWALNATGTTLFNLSSGSVQNAAQQLFSHAEGSYNLAAGLNSHAEGRKNAAIGNHSHAEGALSVAQGAASHAEGYQNAASGAYSHAEGRQAQAKGIYSHAEGYTTQAIGDNSHAEGYNTQAVGEGSHAEGGANIASGIYSHTEGEYNASYGSFSHAEGYQTIASGSHAHSEGNSTTAYGDYSHAEGVYTTASGIYSHAEGVYTTAYGAASHAEGFGTQANGAYSHVQGVYNATNTSFNYEFIIGNGTDNNNRSNLVYASGSQFQVTGSVISSLGFTGSLQGTSSYANNADSSSYSINAVTASFVTSSNVYGPYGANSVLTASYSVTASWALDAALTASNAVTRTGSVFQLGGDLIRTTTIDGDGAGSFYPPVSSSIITSSWFQLVVEDPVTKKIYVGGYPVVLNSDTGVTAYGLLRLNSDFTVDNSFNAGIGTSGSTFGETRAIIIDKTISKVYVAGRFEIYSGSTVNHIVRLNEDGTIDTTFQTNGGATGGAGTATQKGIYDAVMDSSGKIVAAGNFTLYSGSTNNYIVRINQDGSQDATFNNATGFNASGTGVGIDRSGNIYVAGTFTTYKGVGANRIVGLNSDGTRRTAFNVGTGLNVSPGQPVISMTPDDKVIVTGDSFTTYSGSSSVRIARINQDGTIDSTFRTGTGFSVTPGIGAIDSFNRVYIGAWGTSAIGYTYSGSAFTGSIRLLSNGTVDRTFNRRGSGYNRSPYITKQSVYITGSNDYAIIGTPYTISGNVITYNGVSGSIFKVYTDYFNLNLSSSLINYDLDYSYLYTNRTLVDRAYVDGKFTGSFFSGSITISGSLQVSGSITGSLFGTSSWSTNAVTASFITTAQTASFVATSSWANNARTASFIATASWSSNAVTALTASTADSLFARQNITASNARFTTLFITSSSPSTSALTITGSVLMTGSITISNMLVLVSQSLLPGTAPTGAIMTSGSGIDNKPYYWNGATWRAFF